MRQESIPDYPENELFAGSVVGLSGNGEVGGDGRRWEDGAI